MKVRRFVAGMFPITLSGAKWPTKSSQPDPTATYRPPNGRCRGVLGSLVRHSVPLEVPRADLLTCPWCFGEGPRASCVLCRVNFVMKWSPAVLCAILGHAMHTRKMVFRKGSQFCRKHVPHHPRRCRMALKILPNQTPWRPTGLPMEPSGAQRLPHMSSKVS